MLELELIEPPPPIEPSKLGLGGLGQLEEVGGVPAPCRLTFSGSLEHSVPYSRMDSNMSKRTPPVGRRQPSDEVLVHQRREGLEDVGAEVATGIGDRLGRLQGPPPGEHRQTPEEGALVPAEEVDAPPDGLTEGALPGREVDGAVGEQIQSAFEAIEDLLGWERPDPGRRELDRQGEAVESSAQLGDGRGIPLGEGERRVDSRRSIDEEGDRLVPGRVLGNEGVRRSSGTASGGTGSSCSPRRCSGSRLVTKTRSLGSAGDECDHDEGRVDHLLEVVEDQEHLPFPDVVAKGIEGRRATPRARAPTAAAIVDGTRSASVIGPSSTKNTPSRELVQQVRRRLEREPGLAAPARAGERQQTRPSEESLDPGDLSLPSDEASCVGGAGSSASRANGSAGTPMAGRRSRAGRCARARQVLQAVLAEVAQNDVVREARPLTSSAVADERSTCPPCPAAAILAARWTSSPT